MPELRTVDGLVVDVALDNQTDSYSSKPAHVSPEFNNVVAAGAKELSGTTLCCAQLGLALVLTVTVDGRRRHKLLFDAGPEGRSFFGTARISAYRSPTWRLSRSRTATGITWGRCSTRSGTSGRPMAAARLRAT
jgi:hypothetical protein